MKKVLRGSLAFMMVLSMTGCGEKESTPLALQGVFNEGKTYDEELTYDSGIIEVDQVVLENATFKNDLIIDAAVLEGDITLRNINIQGKLIVHGGGKHSIHLEDSQIKTIVSDKEGSPVRIVTDKESTVGSITLEGETLLEVHGAVRSISVNQEGEGSHIQLASDAVVESVDVDGSVELNIEIPLKSLALNAKSSVTLNAEIENITLSKEASNTKVTLGHKGVVDQMKTEGAVEISGTGKLMNIVTNNQNHMTGNLKAEHIEIKEKPLETQITQTTHRPTSTAKITPEPTPSAAASIKETIAPSVVPTATPQGMNIPWDGTSADIGWYNKSATTFTLYNGAQLAGLGKLVDGGNDFKGKTIKLGSDIDLNNKEWTPIGFKYAKAGRTFDGKDAGEAYQEYWHYVRAFSGTFDGNNYTIKKLNSHSDGTNSDSDIALFRYVSDAQIKNLKISDFSLSGKYRVAVVAAYAMGGSTFEHITLSNGKVFVEDAQTAQGTSWATGGIVAQIWNYSSYNVGKNDAIYSFKDCLINADVSLSGESNVGGIWGSVTEATSKFSNIIDAKTTEQEPYWKGDSVYKIEGYHTKMIVENCLNKGTISASIVNAGSMGGWATVAEIDTLSFENQGQIFVKGVEQSSPKVISGGIGVLTVPYSYHEDETVKVIQTQEQLEKAIKDKIKSIQIKGTLGSENDYTIYTITHSMKIQGLSGAKIYGSFIVDADQVAIDGLEIHNQGWKTKDPSDARRNAITVVSNQISITNNKIVASTHLEGLQTISNGVVLLAGTNEHTNINLSGNVIKGYKYDNDHWSSTGIMFVSNLSFPYKATNSKGRTQSVEWNLDFSSIAKDNQYTGCYNDLIYADYSDGAYPYKYTYTSTTYGTLVGLAYAYPTASTIELAPGNYEFTKKDTHSSTGENYFVIKANSELVIPASAQVIISMDTELVLNREGKLNGVVYGKVNDGDAQPVIKNAHLEYEAGSENIIVNFDLDRGFELTIPALTLAELEEVYALLLTGGEGAQAAAKKLGNDVILCYYYLNEDGIKVPLLTSNGNPLIKNKYWNGYLNYLEEGKAVVLEGSGVVAGTLLGAQVPNSKSWITSTNPTTDTVSSGWLERVTGKKAYVDIVVIYNGKITIETASVEIATQPTPFIATENERLMESRQAEVVTEIKETETQDLEPKAEDGAN